jgi:hypothetical protein
MGTIKKAIITGKHMFSGSRCAGLILCSSQGVGRGGVKCPPKRLLNKLPWLPSVQPLVHACAFLLPALPSPRPSLRYNRH